MWFFKIVIFAFSLRLTASSFFLELWLSLSLSHWAALLPSLRASFSSLFALSVSFSSLSMSLSLSLPNSFVYPYKIRKKMSQIHRSSYWNWTWFQTLPQQPHSARHALHRPPSSPHPPLRRRNSHAWASPDQERY